MRQMRECRDSGECPLSPCKLLKQSSTIGTFILHHSISSLILLDGLPRFVVLDQQMRAVRARRLKWLDINLKSNI